ncbi:hypothetical protein Ddc_14400 [Ditylenchus destructor]|nr:hypothetical protein Ddc_14400 [Ditylenchus destructor]
MNGSLPLREMDMLFLPSLLVLTSPPDTLNEEEDARLGRRQQPANMCGKWASPGCGGVRSGLQVTPGETTPGTEKNRERRGENIKMHKEEWPSSRRPPSQRAAPKKDLCAVMRRPLLPNSHQRWRGVRDFTAAALSFLRNFAKECKPNMGCNGSKWENE